MSNGARLRWVVIEISSHLQPFVVKVTPVEEHIMRAGLKHSLIFMSLLAAYTSTEMCEAEESAPLGTP